jgi:hypothetical protein
VEIQMDVGDENLLFHFILFLMWISALPKKKRKEINK